MTPRAFDIFSLAWPMAVKAIFLHGSIVIDGYLVSSLGETSLAAMGLAAALGGIALGMIFAFSHAMQIRTAQAYGTKDPIYIKSALVSGLTISLGIGAIGVTIILMFGWPIISSLASSADVAAQAWSYLTIFTLVVFLESIGQCLSSYFNGCGRTRIPLWGYCLSIPVNIIVSVVLIHGLWGLPKLGVAGAAWGSAIGVAVQVSFFATQFLRPDIRIKWSAAWRNVTFRQTLWRHLVFALPIAATFVSATLSAHVCTLIYASMSLNAFAALTLISPWIMMAGQISMQWTQATGIFVAQLLGQKTSHGALTRFLSTAWRGAFVTAGIVSGVFIALGLSVDVLYADLTDETRAILFSFLPILVLLPFPRATNAICGNTLRASGDTIYVMHIFVWSQWLFRVPATALAVIIFDLSAIWVLAIVLAEEAVKFGPFHRRLYRGDWKHATVTE